MSAQAATDGSILPAVAAVLGLPALVGVVALVEGYPVPHDAASAIGVLAGGFFLVVLGAVVAWLRTVGLLGAPVAAVLGVVGGCGWALLSDGVSAVRVGNAVVLEGAPILMRFVGVTPWLILVVSGIAILEASAQGTTGGPGSTTVGHLAALAYGLLAGLVVAVISLLPGLLLGDLLTAPPLLLYAASGGIVGGTVIGYARLRHRIVTPLLVLAVVAGAAAIAVTAGGSPRGFPMAWPIWVGLGVLLGAIEGLARGIQGRVVGR